MKGNFLKIKNKNIRKDNLLAREAIYRYVEEIMQAFGKRQSHETDIEPREPAGGNQSRSEKEQSDELIAAAGRGGRGLSARRLPLRLRRAGRGFLRGCFLFQGITS